MILLSKVVWGSATVAMLAVSAVAPGAADVARGVAKVFEGSTRALEASSSPAPPHCAGSCDVWAALARTR